MRRVMSRRVERFHRQWTRFLLNATQQTMRRVCHELATLAEHEAHFQDAAFIGVLRRTLEFVITDTGRTKWSVERSRRDLRGRVGKRRRHVGQSGPNAKLRRDLIRRTLGYADVGP